MIMQDAELLSVVVPCFNEAQVINHTHKRLSSVLKGGGATRY
jgi:hypothetical protein